MKKILVITCMMFGSVFAASAQDNPEVTAKERATNLSHEMIRDLRLNNFQSRKVSEINMEVAKQMLAIEKQYAGDQAKIDKLCNGVCAIRDTKLENVLSTVQYNDYFGSRKSFAALDKQFMAEAAQAQQNGNGVASADNPTAANSFATASVN